MDTTIGIIALVLLFVVVAVGFWRKVNVGLLAIAAAVLLAVISGKFTGKEVIAGFSGSLFMQLLGIMFLFGVIQSNGALDLAMKKFVKLFGKSVWMVPILIYIIGWVISAVGPGCVPALAFIAAIAIPLAKETGYNPIMLMLIGNSATYSGRFTPITPEGILVTKLMGEQGITGMLWPMVINVFIGTVLLCVVAFIWYKGYKVKSRPINVVQEELPKFNWKQIATLISILAMVALVIFLKLDVGLASFLVAVVLILIQAGDQKFGLKSVPWGTLVLVCGVGVLMNLVSKSGGITLLTNALASIMTPATAAPIMGLSAGVMSWFSSTMGVVLPTLLPTVGGIVSQVGGTVSAIEILSVIGLISSCAGFSPASTVGAIMMSAYEGDPVFSKQKEPAKLFLELFLWSVFCVVFFALLALTGLFGIIG